VEAGGLSAGVTQDTPQHTALRQPRGNGEAVVALDEGGSLAGNDPIDSNVTVSADRSSLRHRRASSHCPTPRPAAAQPSRPAPPAIHHRLEDGDRVTPQRSRLTPAIATSDMAAC
jgi:hypothetical protein